MKKSKLEVQRSHLSISYQLQFEFKEYINILKQDKTQVKILYYYLLIFNSYRLLYLNKIYQLTRSKSVATTTEIIAKEFNCEASEL